MTCPHCQDGKPCASLRDVFKTASTRPAARSLERKLNFATDRR